MSDDKLNLDRKNQTGHNSNQLPVKSSDNGQDDDFIIVEATDKENHDLVGIPSKISSDDDLGIQSTTAMMNESAQLGSADKAELTSKHSANDSQPIGESAPILPSSQANEPIEAAPSSIRHLSESEVQSIRDELYTTEPAKKQAQVATTKPTPAAKMPDDNQNTHSNQPSRPADQELKKSSSFDPGTTKSKSSEIPKPVDKKQPVEQIKRRGIAHFYKNYIQLPSGQTLRENDELSVRGRHFVLRRKALSPKMVIAAAVPLFALLLIFAVNMFVGGDIGEGKVIGLVVDDFGVPYEGKAIVRFPELGKAYRTDAMGFFETDRLPSGSHRVEYMVDGVSVGSDYCTILSDQLSKLLLSPSQPETDSETADLLKAEQEAKIEIEKVAEAPKPKAVKKATSQKATNTSTAKLLLDANIENATLEIDGKTIGIGNMTYTRLKAGNHTYTVSRDGFDDATGTVQLKSAKSTTLAVNLTPLTDEAKAEVYSADDYFFSAQSMAQAGDDISALADFGRAIELNPGYSEAYLLRADILMRAKRTDEAFADYLRAGEIYQIQNNHSRAASAFSKAIDADENAIEAVIGRGNSHLARAEYIAAVTDFERAIGINKKNAAAHTGLGLARFKHGQYKKAIKAFKKSRDLKPSDPSIHQYLMLAYLANNEVKNVKKSYNKFLAIATEKQVNAFQADQRYAAIIRVVDMGNK